MEQGHGIRRRRPGKICKRNTAEIGDTCRCGEYVFGFVTFPSPGVRREKGTVGFKQQGGEWYFPRDFPEVIGILIRDYPWNREEKTKVDRSAGHRVITGKAMHDTAGREGTALLENAQHVVVSVPVMDDHRQVEGSGQFQLDPEMMLLQFRRAVHFGVIKPDLSVASNVFPVFPDKFDNVDIRTVVVRRQVVGMDSH